MAHSMPRISSQGNAHMLHQKMMQKGNPNTAHSGKNTMKSNKLTKGTKGQHAGDVVSDDSDNGDHEGDSSAIEDESHDSDDSDEADGVALSGAKHIGEISASRLIGLSHENGIWDEDDAVSGAEHEGDEGGEQSDDEDYGDVENISDSEDSIADADEGSIIRSAEKDLIAEFRSHERPGTSTGVTSILNGMSLAGEAALTRRLSLQSEESQQDDLDLDLPLDWNHDPFGGLTTQEELYHDLLEDAEDALDNDFTSWRMPQPNLSRETSALSATTQKKVRFEESTLSRTSSMSSDEDPREIYPDLFAEIDDPTRRQQILLSAIENEATQETDSVYDFEFEDEYEKTAFDIDRQSDSDSGTSADDDSDDGDTTDEETAEEQLARVRAIKEKKGSVPSLGALRSIPGTPASSKRDTAKLSRTNSKTPNNQFVTPVSARRPKAGTFAHDPTQASVTADINGSGVKLVCPSKPPEKDREYWERARQVMGSRDGSPGGSVSWTRSTPRTASIPQRPFTVKSTLGTMFDGNLDFLQNNDEHGIAKEFLQPMRKNSMQSSFTSNTLTDGDGSDDSSNVNMADFVQMDDSDSDMEEVITTGVTWASRRENLNEIVSGSSPMAGKHSGSGSGMLGHLDQQRGLVSSFRNNQHHARHVSSLAAHPAKRAQTSEANALQKGRRAAANAPMTPARKKRQDLDITATNAGVRKNASPIVHKHRRGRGSSLSGMHQTLALDRFASEGH